MDGDVTAPDVTSPDQYSGLAACGQLTQDKIDEYAATVKFIKLLAGIGPDNDVRDARDAVRQAIANALATPERLQEAEAAARAAEERFRAETNRVFGEGDIADDVAMRPAIYLNDPNYADQLYGDDAWYDAWEANNDAIENTYRVSAQISREEWNAWIQGWVDWFNEIKTKLGEGRVLEMICAVLVEGTFIVVEELVTWGMAAVAGAVTGGVGAIAVKIVARATIAGSRTALVSVRAVRVVGSEALTRQALGRANDVSYPRPVDASDLEGPEARILDEDFYGGHDTQETIDGNLTPEEPRAQTTEVDGAGDGAPVPETSGRQLTDEEWEPLRDATPSRANRRVIQGQHPTATPENPVDDPWLPGHPRTATIQADHIVPAARIRRMDGFADLTEEHQLEVLNFQDNFHGLSASANASRGELSFRDWTTYHRRNIPVNPQLRQAMIAEEERLEGVLQGMIYDRIREQNATPDIPFRNE